MIPHYNDGPVTIYAGDCIQVMRELPDNSVDSVVTDPPYGLEFMGREWDSFGAPQRDARTAGRAGSGAVLGGAAIKADGGLAGSRVAFGGQRTMTNECAICGVRDLMAIDDRHERRQGHAPQWQRVSTTVGAPPAMKAFQAWCEQWATEAYRVLKPGGHLLAFGGTRTFHRLTAGIEDAGFEIRDSVAWVYAQGFPKSLNVSRDPSFCQCPGGEPENGSTQGIDPVEQIRPADLSGMRQELPSVADETSRASTPDVLSAVQGSARRGPAREDRPARIPSKNHANPTPVRGGQPSLEWWGDTSAREGELRPSTGSAMPTGVRVDEAPQRVRPDSPDADGTTPRPPVDPLGVRQPHQPRPAGQPSGEPRAVPDEPGSQARGSRPVCARCGKAPVTPGLGTAMKPAFEPVTVARKPLTGTVAANVLQWGTGALNIDATRIGMQAPIVTTNGGQNAVYGDLSANAGTIWESHAAGRWPANVVLDETQAAALDAQSGQLTSGKMQPTHTTAQRTVYGQNADGGYTTMETYGDTGGASRFFYTAKAAQDERPSVDGTSHPTVKPVDLMRWLVKLVTPPGGTVLEPFAGSGTTAEACVLEGFHCIAIEREAEYLPLILKRIRKPHAVGLDFGDWDGAA